MQTQLSAKPIFETALEEIRRVVGDKGIVTEPAEMDRFVLDQRDKFAATTALVVRPNSTEETSAVVGICARHDIPIVPQAGNTSLCGGSLPSPDGREIVLSLERMNRIREIDTDNYAMTVEAGCILADVQTAAANHDRLFPLSLGAEGSCRIGGNLSTNAGGNNVLRYGMARELVLGLEVVLADGQIWNGLRGLRKDNTGYDIKQLFIGSEGTLGIITAAVLKLFPRPRDIQTAFVAVPDTESALALLVLAKSLSGDGVTGFELIPRIGIEFVLAHIPDTHDPLEQNYDHYILVELSSGENTASSQSTMERLLEQAFEQGLVLDGTIAASTAQAQALWKLRDSLTEAQKPEGGSIKHDVSVPVSQVPEFLRRGIELVTSAFPGCRPVPFGHIGDGNIHFNISQPVGAERAAYLANWEEMNRMVHDLVIEMNGSFSAEHGIGQLKRDDLLRYKPHPEIDLMRRIKTALDPQGLLNPGKIV